MTIIRQIEPADAPAFATLLGQLDGETDFLLFEPDERRTTAAQWHEIIRHMQLHGDSMIFVAEHDGELVGYLRANRETMQRLDHNLLIMVAIRQAYTGLGLGTRLFTRMELWARRRAIHRLYLTVMAHNTRAIALYKKMNFVVEGLHRDAIRIDGAFVDEYTMAKLLM